MKKIEVSKDLCIGCGACIAIDSEHFDFSDEGLSKVIDNSNLESPTLKEAMEACPTNAINFVESESCECGDDCKCEEQCNCNEECDCGEECNCEGCDCDEE